MKSRYCIRVLTILVVASAGTAFAAPSEQSLAARVAAQLKLSLSGTEIAVSDPLTLQLKLPSQTNVQINLDRISNFCTANSAEDCDHEISDFVAKTVVFAKSQMAPLRIELLRAAVRPAEYVGTLNKMAISNGTELISEPLAGDLVTLCYFDAPTTMRPAMTKDLPAIGLEPSNAMAMCKANVKAALPPLDAILAQQPAGKGGLLHGDAYESSYLIYASDWSVLAAKYGGHLLVAVPDVDTVIYAEDDGPDSVAHVSDAVKQLKAQAERSMSDEVFRWTPSGWQVVAP